MKSNRKSSWFRLALVWTLLCVWFNSCALTPTPETSGVRFYHLEVNALPWSLTIKDPTGTTVRKVITSTTPNVGDMVASSGFKWQTEHENCIQLQFNGSNHYLEIQPRDIIELTVDGQPEFYGVYVTGPSIKDRNEGQFTVLGGMDLLKKTITGATVFENQGVFDIATTLIQDHLPAALTFDPLLIGTPGEDAVLSTYYEPYKNLWDALGALEKTLPSQRVRTGVNAEGKIFFHTPAAAPTEVSYESQPWKWLPVTAEDVVSESILQILTSVGGTQQPDLVATWVDDGLGSYTGGQPYFPAPVQTTATHATHAQYGTQATFQVPEGKSVIKGISPTNTTSNQVTNPANAFDGDPGTWATFDPPGTQASELKADSLDIEGRTVGVKIVYSMTWAPGDPQDVAAIVQYRTGDTAKDTYYKIYLKKTEPGQTGEIYVLVPPSTKTGNLPYLGDIWLYCADSGLPGGALKVFSIELLQVDEAIAESIAESFLRVPAQIPAQIELDGLQTVGDSITITDVPDGGDLTGPVAMVERELSTEGRKTRVQIGEKNIRLDARQITQVVQQAAHRATDQAVRLTRR